MKPVNKRIVLFSISIVLIASLFQYSYSAEKKIRIVSENAEVKKTTDAKAATVAKLPIGTELTYEAKVGDWYKVYLLLDGKKTIVGYLHGASVEEIGQNRKIIVYLRDGLVVDAALISEDQEKIKVNTESGEMIFAKNDIAKTELIVDEPPTSQEPIIKPTPVRSIQGPAKPKKIRYSRPRPKAEIGLFVAGAGPNIMATSKYEAYWNYERLTDVAEISDISLSSKFPVYLEGTFSYFPKGPLGFRLSVGYYGAKPPTTSNSELSWTWDGTDSYSDSWIWRETSEWTSVPISADLALRFGGYKVNGYLFGGISFFYNEFKAKSFIVFSDTQYQSYDNSQYIDVAQVPIVVGKVEDPYSYPYGEEPKLTWVSFGGNIGAGIDIMISKNFALAVEGGYFFSPSRTIRWGMVPGWYTGMYGYLSSIEISEQYVDNYNEFISPMDLKTSFYRFSGGIKICF